MAEILTEKSFQRSQPEGPAPKVVKFTNFSNEDFTHTLNNIPYTFRAGESKYMEYGVAAHFAKHFVNRELLKRGRENDTSPKKMQDNPFFMELWNRCISAVDLGDGPTDQTKLEQDIIDRNVREQLAKKEGKGAKTSGRKSAQSEPEPESTRQSQPDSNTGGNSGQDEESQFEDLPEDTEDDDLPPDNPSNMASKGQKDAGKDKKNKAASKKK